MLEKILKSIEPFTPNVEKSSSFCRNCGHPATRLVKYSTEWAVIIEKYCKKCSETIQVSSSRDD
ncbi:MAG TPA: hypothetical protein VJS91_11420 [Nitrososphaeraceae archaeon]|nr:hypothetical protein [Nitrososphaeraceae archaeon]